MKQLPLSQGKFALLDDEDYDRLCHFRWFYRPENLDQGYATRHGRKTDRTQTVYLHREIMDPPPGHQVRFLNHDQLDCRKENLRVLTAEEAHQRLNCKVDTKCVRQDRHNGWYHAYIYLPDGQEIYLGRFGFKDEANAACREAWRKEKAVMHPSTEGIVQHPLSDMAMEQVPGEAGTEGAFNCLCHK